MDSILSIIQKSIKKVSPDFSELDTVSINQVGENLTPNLRAIRLAVTIADHLLSMGAAASDAVHMAIGITNTYCTRKVHIDISYTLLTVSQDRGVEREPLTIVRTISGRDPDYRMVQKIQELAVRARDRKITLEDAEKQLDVILANPKQPSPILAHIAGGGITAGVSILYTGSIAVVALSFMVGFLMSWLVHRLVKLIIPSFFIQVAAAMLATLVAAGLSWAVNNDYLASISYINPTLIIVGGLVMLLSGMMVVGAMQDAIDEYYMTASARLLKVIMLTGGIVMGVVMGLYLSRKFGVTFAATPERLTLVDVSYQYIGAAIMAGSFALGTKSRLTGIIISGAVGVLGYSMMLLALEAGLGLVPSYGVAAIVIGFTATLTSRAWRIPSMATTGAGIIPLVPGLSLYNGLMLTLQSNPGTAAFNDGNAILLQALLIAVAIAAGASFGNIIGRPMRRRMVKISNGLPLRQLNRHSKVKELDDAQSETVS